MSPFADTPEYRESIERQHEITDAACLVWDLDRVETPDPAAPLDCLLTRDGYVRAVVEVKERNLTPAEFLALDNPRSGRHANSGYLIKAGKLESGAAVAAGLLVPFVLLVGVYPSREIWYWELWAPHVGWRVAYTTDTIETQAHAEGGRKIERCAFVPISAGRPL